MTAWKIAFLLCLGLICSVCIPACNQHRKFGNPPVKADLTIAQKDFDLNRIETIIFSIENEPFAAIQPRLIKSISTKEYPNGQLSAWELLFLNENPVMTACGKSNGDLVIDRITPTDRRLTLDFDRRKIWIGGFDHEIEIYPSADDPSRYQWEYWSGEGNVCSGEASFVLKP